MNWGDYACHGMAEVSDYRALLPPQVNCKIFCICRYPTDFLDDSSRSRISHTEFHVYQQLDLVIAFATGMLTSISEDPFSR